MLKLNLKKNIDRFHQEEMKKEGQGGRKVVG